MPDTSRRPTVPDLPLHNNFKMEPTPLCPSNRVNSRMFTCPTRIDIIVEVLMTTTGHGPDPPEGSSSSPSGQAQFSVQAILFRNLCKHKMAITARKAYITWTAIVRCFRQRDFNPTYQKKL
ncbi:hypothetical protein AVEN_176129-1 [Araneus ventricosus]|uniref:Uncharacterized protein n=1 Tax=Araneus ventricosus TaxID=182803 RepID=A0A4Y2K5X9_ARAVE|nr:hypothetical protein AVEN_176129-1 [Araneus ventricosus]